jgi:hypothetical protein
VTGDGTDTIVNADRIIGTGFGDTFTITTNYAGGQFNRNKSVAQLGNTAQKTACGDNLVALDDALDHVLVLLLLFHLRADHHQVQNAEHHQNGQHVHQGGLHVATGGSGSGLGKGRRDEHRRTPRMGG